MNDDRQMTIRDVFASSALNGMYANRDMTRKAVDEWCENGGPRPICVAEWFAGMAYEAADAMMKARNHEPENAPMAATAESDDARDH